MTQRHPHARETREARMNAAIPPEVPVAPPLQAALPKIRAVAPPALKAALPKIRPVAPPALKAALPIIQAVAPPALMVFQPRLLLQAA
eukprot:CAMPEP_0178874140 /NCGR_PEP_ID=MMETSP0747-20121128/9057_1 /TAXON_ID=913974 /ORGANISM="Nitzschia punctata, Strain CCMP561" /LENGTH=87 /DNA_ID=CAMNT_0020541519 /DNA_START=436 /DNA_END=696 /DNA_ORIENTATION=+